MNVLLRILGVRLLLSRLGLILLRLALGVAGDGRLARVDVEAAKLLFLAFAGAGHLDLLLALGDWGARAGMTELEAAVSALHQPGTLVLAGEPSVTIRLAQARQLGALDQLVVEPAMALELEVDGAGRAWSGVAAPVAGVLAAGRPSLLALGLALFTIDPGRLVVLGVAHPVTLALAGVVGAGQLAAAATPTRGRLGLVAGKLSNLVLPETLDRDRSATGRTLEPAHLNQSPFLPGPGRSTFLGQPYLDVVVAGRRALVAAIQLVVADLSAGRAGPGMAEML